jgi:hypothetical protein
VRFSLTAFLLTVIVFGTVLAAESSQVRGRVFWRGMVDDRVQLSISGTTLEMETLSGNPYPEGVYSFTAELPEEPVVVRVNKRSGRGSVNVIQQPAELNGYTAIVEIHDPRGGAREYQLEIFWR